MIVTTDATSSTADMLVDNLTITLMSEIYVKMFDYWSLVC